MTALEQHPNWVLLKFDISNAFNSVDRACLLSQVKDVFPDIGNHVSQMYGVPSSLIYSTRREKSQLCFFLSKECIKEIRWDQPVFASHPSYSQ